MMRRQNEKRESGPIPGPELKARRHDPYVAPPAPPPSAPVRTDLVGIDALNEKYAAELNRGRELSKRLGG